MDQIEREKYARWQNHRISQLSFSINLFLGFAVASLAYVINLLLKDAKGNHLLEMVLLIWSFSAASGCFSTISRLLDFRYTVQKIRNAGKFNSAMAKYTGSFTWGFFWSQVLTYIIGAYVFISYYVLQ